MAIDCGKILKETRKKIGVTQEELADVAGVSINSIKLIEQGKMNPTVQMFDLIMDCLGMEIIVNQKQPNLNMYKNN
ncbi:MAG: helix-turn-helix domain-containing protein [Bacteroidales bacterium]|nr:helix-turn-helix domain-containing protein [Bacteroidales bacterium]